MRFFHYNHNRYCVDSPERQNLDDRRMRYKHLCVDLILMRPVVQQEREKVRINLLTYWPTGRLMRLRLDLFIKTSNMILAQECTFKSDYGFASYALRNERRSAAITVGQFQSRTEVSKISLKNMDSCIRLHFIFIFHGKGNHVNLY